MNDENPEISLAPMQRLGKFHISCISFRQDFEAIQGIFSLCVPVRAEMMFDRDCIEYTAIGHVFDEITKGTIPPFYTVSLDRDGLTVGVSFERHL